MILGIATDMPDALTAVRTGFRPTRGAVAMMTAITRSACGCLYHDCRRDVSRRQG